MPNLEFILLKKDKHNHRSQRRYGIARQHRSFLIPLITQSPGKNAEHHIRSVRTHHQKRRHQRRAFLGIRPDHQRITGHGAAQAGKRLGKPQSQVGLHLFYSVKKIVYVFHRLCSFSDKFDLSGYAKSRSSLKITSPCNPALKDFAWSFCNAHVIAVSSSHAACLPLSYKPILP